jgi:tRNA nucleotidyltransferase/poly(A) polymerase
MTAPMPDLAGAHWLAAPAVRRVFALLSGDGEEARVVGGAVRNALMGLPVIDVDFGTTATPDRVAARAKAAGIKAAPTGVEHGTLTLVVEGRPFEVTTLREDIKTDGRHAVVRFGTDWDADARRRDFTVNALSVDADGKVYDPVGGYEDVIAGRIRFIGDPDRRIAEDRLRILRFFRFHAEYGKGDIDAVGLAAVTRARGGLRDLSAERIGQEMRRLMVAPRAAETVTLMQEAGILPIVLAGIGYLGPFDRLVRFEAAVGLPATVPLRLAALACRIEEDVLRLTERLRLTNAERDRMLRALAAARSLTPPPNARGARRALYRHGAVAFRDGAALAFAWSDAASDDPVWRELATLPDRWTAPKFPLSGRDIVAGGRPPGPAVGALLAAVEAWWIDEDFAPDATALRQRLQQLMAEQ